MKLSAFPWYRPAFREYNVAQAAAVPWLDKDVNLVVSFATAAGKTVLAECCFAYHLSSSESCRVVYVCPFRSLASEKLKAWTNEMQLSRYGVVLGTGDSDAGLEEHENARIAVMTAESFDAKTRSRHWRDWMKSLTCVVFDEAHMMGTRRRGGAMESAMMRFSAAVPLARLVLLSATMGNAMEVAKWVKTLNNKPTKCITSNWRPSKVVLELVASEGPTGKVDEAVKLAAGNHGKTIVFVHSKVVGMEILRKLRKARVRAAFHNASVSASLRRRIEEAFNSPASNLNVVIATSTLSSGVNMG